MLLSVGQRYEKGRVLEAARDIKEGEMVLVDRAVAVVPNDVPVCLGCLTRLPPSSSSLNSADKVSNCDNNNTTSESKHKCQKCSFPFCGDAQCDVERWHSKLECEALEKSNAAEKLFRTLLNSRDGATENAEHDDDDDRNSVKTDTELSPTVRINQFYHVIATLRLILAQEHASNMVKQQMGMLMDHNDTR